MKMKLCLSLLFALGVCAGTAGAHEFTDLQGRKLEAELVSVAGDQLTLKRASDGQNFTVPRSTFSADDQKVISDFADANMNYRFEVRFAKTKLDEVKQRKKNTTYEKETWAYKVDLCNLSAGPVSDIRVDYWCFRRDDDGKGKGSPKKESSGSIHIESLPRTATKQFETMPVEINKQKLDAGWYYVNGNKNQQADAMGGLVLRVFKGTREVYSFATKDDLLAQATGKVDPDPDMRRESR